MILITVNTCLNQNPELIEILYKPNSKSSLNVGNYLYLTCLNQTLDKMESYIYQTLNKVSMQEIAVKLTCVNYIQ